MAPNDSRRRSPGRLLSCLATACAALTLALPTWAAAEPSCGRGPAQATVAGRPTAKLAWRAGLLAKAPIHRGIPGAGGRRSGTADPHLTPWLLVLRTAKDKRDDCWAKVRLPGRPNDRAGWIAANRLFLTPTPWRLAVDLGTRTLTAYRAGRALRTFAVVIGAPSTPTPSGLFSIVGAWRGDPNRFLGSWTLGLTAHSNVLEHFEGGDGEVGIHGRGGESLLDPLGSAASHGCVRLANRAIEWLVRSIGPNRLPGIPVRVS